MATQADLDILTFIPTERADRRRRDLDRRMAGLFQLFEKDDTGLCDVREVATIVRAMGLNPPDSVVTKVIEAIEEPEATGYVSLAKLQEVLVGMASTYEFNGTLVARESEETLLRAFEMLDPDRKGYVDAEYLKEVMTTTGERFNTEEALEMINAAADPDTGRIYYEDYAPLLATE